MPEVTCSICTYPLMATSICCSTQCGHVYHQDCLNKWLDKKSNCPECRAICPVGSVIQLYLNVDEPPKKSREVRIDELMKQLDLEFRACDLSAMTEKSSTRAPRRCQHQAFDKLECLDHKRSCKGRCLRQIPGVFLTNFPTENETSCSFCIDCVRLQCYMCLQKLSGTCVRYDGGFYHENCFPCLECNEPMERSAGNLMRPSQLYHNKCLHCYRCTRKLKGQLYNFPFGDVPFCQNGECEM